MTHPDPRAIAACNSPSAAADWINRISGPSDPRIKPSHVVAVMSDFGIGTFFEAAVFAREMLAAIGETKNETNPE